jgi:hypothetical protein
MDSQQVYTWEEFKEEAAKLRAASRFGAPVLFRGQRSSKWELSTTLERSGHDETVMEYYRLIMRVKPEIETSVGRRWVDDPTIPELEELTLQYDTFSRALINLPHYEYIAYLRHHGFPSPLLDWSQSPFVAAYFAFCEDLEFASEVAIYAYTELKRPFKIFHSDAAHIYPLGPYVPVHQRHFAQQSRYTICVHWSNDRWTFLPHSSVFEDQKDSNREQDVLTKFVLRSNDRPKVLRELNDYNLNAYTLFGTQEGLMQSLSIREELSDARAKQPDHVECE